MQLSLGRGRSTEPPVPYTALAAISCAMVAFTLTLSAAFAAGAVTGAEHRSSVAEYTGVLALLVLVLLVLFSVLAHRGGRRSTLVARLWAGAGGLLSGTVLGGAVILPGELLYLPAFLLSVSTCIALTIDRLR